MKRATEVLRKEHDAILQMLDAAGRAGERLEVETMGAGTHERLHAKTDRIPAQLPSPEATEPPRARADRNARPAISAAQMVRHV